MMAQLASVVALVVGAATSTPNRTITVFHVNSISYGAAPINMDIADLQGDMYFDLRSKILPIECNKSLPEPGHDCSNPEVTASNLVITKLSLDINPLFGEYAYCNVCENKSAGISGPCDVDGEYVCSCTAGWGGYTCMQGKCVFSKHGSMTNETCHASCKSDTDVLSTASEQTSVEVTNCPNNRVGMRNISARMSNYGCRENSPEYECWRENVAKKTKGFWYSTLEDGYCGNGTAPAPADCTWAVRDVIKVINKTCSDNSIYNTIETYDALHGHGCFKAGDCPVGMHRNTSTLCWITCFYNVLLGPGGGKPNGNITGMPLDMVIDAWNKPFDSDDVSEGGCPPLSNYWV